MFRLSCWKKSESLKRAPEMSDSFKNAMALIEEFEGFEPKPYLCPAGKWTIGFGDTRWNGKEVTSLTKPVTRQQAEDALRRRLQAFQMELDRLVNVHLNPNQNAALLSFIYNLGAQNLRKSTLLKVLNAGDYQEAANQFMRWNEANGKELAGLTRRREAERKLFLTPVERKN